MSKSRAQAVKISDSSLLKLDNQVCFALHSTSRLVIRKYQSLLERLGVTYPQCLVLLVLWEWEDQSFAEPNFLALGKRLDLDCGTLTPLLKRMEANGLVVREAPLHDKRERYIRLTKAGHALRRRARNVPLTLIEKSPVPLDELIQLRNALLRLRDALSEPT